MDRLAAQMTRMQATIHSACTWALETEQPQLLTEAARARDAWANTRLVLGAHTQAVQVFASFGSPMNERAT
eukprot:11640325-Prorocentrum_lima.AAC.1